MTPCVADVGVAKTENAVAIDKVHEYDNDRALPPLQMSRLMLPTQKKLRLKTLSFLHAFILELFSSPALSYIHSGIAHRVVPIRP